MLELVIKALLAYMLGSINGALLVGRLYGGVDIRKTGSGNAGGTNAFRTQGSVFALNTVVIDVGINRIEDKNRTIIGCVIAETEQWGNASKLDKIKIIKEHLIKHFEAVLLPKRFRFLSELPYNQQSKLSKEKVLGLFDDR